MAAAGAAGRRLVVISAGMGSPSSTRMLGDRLASATAQALPGPVEIRVLEVRELVVDLAKYAATGMPGERLREAFDLVGSASGVIAVTPVFNAGVSGLFKLFFDLLDEGVMRGRPVLLGATAGTPRHSLVIDHAMLPLFFYLKAVIAPTGVFASTDDWGSADSGLAARIERAAGEFAELVATRPGSAPADEFSDVPDFKSLLGKE